MRYLWVRFYSVFFCRGHQCASKLDWDHLGSSSKLILVTAQLIEKNSIVITHFRHYLWHFSGFTIRASWIGSKRLPLVPCAKPRSRVHVPDLHNTVIEPNSRTLNLTRTITCDNSILISMNMNNNL